MIFQLENSSLIERIYRMIFESIHEDNKTCCETTKVVLDSRIGKANILINQERQGDSLYLHKKIGRDYWI